jgi:small conductance mechanosensitive channel
MEPFMDPQIETLSRTQQALAAFAVQFAPKVISAALILLVGFFVTRWAGRLAARGLVKFDLEPPVRHLLERIAKVLVFGLFLLMALQNLGVELLPLIAGLGIAGAGIALAMQGVMGNVAAGLTIIFTRPFRVGEYISIAGEEGEVRHVSLFNTILRHADLSDVVIPNRKVAGEILHNYGTLRQLDVVVGVAYDTDIKLALQTIHDLLAGHPTILREPDPVVSILALTDSGAQIAIRPWVTVSDFIDASSDITQAVLETFRERGIHIPYPQREVRLLDSARLDSTRPVPA